MTKRDDTRDTAITVQGGLALVRSAVYWMSGATDDQAECLETANNALNDAAAALERFIFLRNQMK